MPTIKEALIAAIEALRHAGYRPGGAVYDDLAQVLKQLDESTLAESLEA